MFNFLILICAVLSISINSYANQVDSFRVSGNLFTASGAQNLDGHIVGADQKYFLVQRSAPFVGEEFVQVPRAGTGGLNRLIVPNGSTPTDTIVKKFLAQKRPEIDLLPDKTDKTKAKPIKVKVQSIIKNGDEAIVLVDGRIKRIRTDELQAMLAAQDRFHGRSKKRKRFKGKLRSLSKMARGNIAGIAGAAALGALLQPPAATAGQENFTEMVDVMGDDAGPETDQ